MPETPVSGVTFNLTAPEETVAPIETSKSGCDITAHSCEYAVEPFCITRTFCAWMLEALSTWTVYSAVLKSVEEIVKESMKVVTPAVAANVPNPVWTPNLSTWKVLTGFVVATPTLPVARALITVPAVPTWSDDEWTEPLVVTIPVNLPVSYTHLTLPTICSV